MPQEAPLYAIIMNYRDTGTPARIEADEQTVCFSPGDDYLTNVLETLIDTLYPLADIDDPDPIAN